MGEEELEEEGILSSSEQTTWYFVLRKTILDIKSGRLYSILIVDDEFSKSNE
jgi:hypothetical protein